MVVRDARYHDARRAKLAERTRRLQEANGPRSGAGASRRIPVVITPIATTPVAIVPIATTRIATTRIATTRIATTPIGGCQIVLRIAFADGTLEIDNAGGATHDRRNVCERAVAAGPEKDIATDP
jgi:hypothetical protein